MSSFNYKGNQFLLDGMPYQIRSGAIHYFRVPSCYWYDRLLKLKECGFNTVETYIAWNFHEECEGEFDFTGEKDLGKYIDIATDLGLKVILRPGPFICAEWEFGGLPAWLLKYNGIKFRCDNPIYLQKVEKYISKIAKIIRPRLISNGGSVIMLQVENEYGSYGNDKVYLKRLLNLYKKYKLDKCVLFTADGSELIMIESGNIDGCLPTFTFGSRTVERMNRLKGFIGDKPLMCSEFWCGWFDHWHNEHHVRDLGPLSQDFEDFLINNWNFNMYMFHGGTNFGFMNGANSDIMENDKYCPSVTSYDYCAPLNEAGDRTPRYYAIKKLIEKYTGEHIECTAVDSEKTAFGKVTFSAFAPLFDNLENIGTKFESVIPLTMEECGQNYGYILYTTTLGKYMYGTELRLMNLADRANLFLNGEKFAVVERDIPHDLLHVTTNESTARLDILVENMGRINYGANINDKKGITGIRTWEVQPFHWIIYKLPMNNLSKLKFIDLESNKMSLPAFYRSEINIDKVTDTYVKPYGFSKGFIVINGNNLGRYYNEAGPQKTLYCPKSFLQKGINEIIVFDSDGVKDLGLEFVSEPIL